MRGGVKFSNMNGYDHFHMFHVFCSDMDVFSHQMMLTAQIRVADCLQWISACSNFIELRSDCQTNTITLD